MKNAWILLAELSPQIYYISKALQKWAATTIPNSQEFCSIAITKLKDLGSALLSTVQDAWASDANQPAQDIDPTLLVNTTHPTSSATPIDPITPDDRLLTMALNDFLNDNLKNVVPSMPQDQAIAQEHTCFTEDVIVIGSPEYSAG